MKSGDRQLTRPPAEAARLRRPPEAYDPVAKLLHWGMALALAGMIGLGLYMQGQPVSMRTFQLFNTHKALGITLLVLAVLRLVWRAWRGAPPMLTHQSKAWELLLARAVHVLLYVLMIGIPILGWLGASASGLPMTYFGWTDIPALVGPSERFQDLAFTLHGSAVWLLVVVIVLHIVGALKRHLIIGDDTLRRMLPFGAALTYGRRSISGKNQ